MHGTFDRFQWTAASVRRLKELIDEKLSATRAAEDLGITRNAVIGKAHRLGWSFQSESKNNGQKFAEVNHARRQPRQPRQPRRVSGGRLWQIPAPLFAVPLPVMSEEPGALRLTVNSLIEGGNGVLKETSCRWIVTNDHPMLYCGHTKEVNDYCAHHAAKMYLPPNSRNREPRPR